jgi:deoxyribonuclease V
LLSNAERSLAPVSYAWPETAAELEEEQRRLGGLVVEEWIPSSGHLDVGACFVCFRRGYSGTGEPGEPAWCAAVRMRGQRIAEHAVTTERAGGSYAPGLLALREGPALESVVRNLSQLPEVLLVNASGRDHPRRAGLALHLGAVLDIPTIGVTHRPFAGDGEWPANDRGKASPITSGEGVVAHWLRSRPNARPIVVHSAWRTSPEVALEIVRRCTYRARTPQPLRHARRLARLMRAGRVPT